MRARQLPYNRPDIGEEEIAAVEKVLRSGWITRGSATAEFEHVLEEYLGVPRVVALSSCTAALHVALLVAGIGPGDVVLTTPLTYAATVNAILYVGATPQLVDVDDDTGNLNLDLAERAITSRTRAIVPVHYGGQAVDMEKLGEIGQDHHLTIVEDAAHALGSRYQGRLVGTFGHLTAFSFYATKNVTTAEGGALVVPDGIDVEKVRRVSSQGMSKNAWMRYAAAGTWRYDVTELGFKYNMTDIQAALGLAQMKKLAVMQDQRRRLAEQYHKQLEGLPLKRPFAQPGCDHAWHLYPIRLRLGDLTGTRDDVIELMKAARIGTSVHFIPLSHHSYYQARFGWKVGDFPVADQFFSEVLSLPLYPAMTPEDVDEVATVLGEILRGMAR